MADVTQPVEETPVSSQETPIDIPAGEDSPVDWGALADDAAFSLEEGEVERKEKEPPKIDPPKEEVPAVPTAPVEKEKPVTKEEPVGKATPPKAEEGDKEPPLSYQAWYDSQVDSLVKGEYALTEDEKAQLDMEPSRVLPILAAKLHMNIATTVTSAILSNLPGYLTQQNEQQARYTALENQFYEAWPALKDKPEFIGEISQAIQGFKEVNPNYTPEQLIHLVGMHVSATHGLPVVPGKPQQSQPVPVKQKVPAAPPPPAAASAGSGGFSHREELPDNPYERLAATDWD